MEFSNWILSVGNGASTTLSKEGECEPSWIKIPTDLFKIPDSTFKQWEGLVGWHSFLVAIVKVSDGGHGHRPWTSLLSHRVAINEKPFS